MSILEKAVQSSIPATFCLDEKCGLENNFAIISIALQLYCYMSVIASSRNTRRE